MKCAVSHPPSRCLFFKCVPFFFISISDNSCCSVWLLQTPLTCQVRGVWSSHPSPPSIAPVPHAGVLTAGCWKHLTKISLLNESKTTKRDVSRKKLTYASLIVVDFYWSNLVFLFFYNSVMHLLKNWRVFGGGDRTNLAFGPSLREDISILKVNFGHR